MPEIIPGVEGLILLESRVDRQLAYQSGKFTSKLLDKKSVTEIIQDLGYKDLQTAAEAIQKDQTGEIFSQLTNDVLAANLANMCPDDGTANAQLFVAGFNSNINLNKIKELSQAANKNSTNEFLIEMLKDDLLKDQNKTKSEVLKQPVMLRIRRPGNGCDPDIIGKVPNKPDSGLTTNSSSWNLLNSFRGGSSEKVVDFKIEEFNDKNFLTRFLKTFKKYRSKILFVLIVGGIITLIFKNRKFLSKFLTRLRKFQKKIKKIKNNRFVRGAYLFVKVCNCNYS